MSYEVELVDCPRCQGMGETYDADLFMGVGFTSCTYCYGSGDIEVCANCLDQEDGCTVCRPPTAATGDSGAVLKDSGPALVQDRTTE